VISHEQPGFGDILKTVRKETAEYAGRKCFMKASFDAPGVCSMYPGWNRVGIESKIRNALVVAGEINENDKKAAFKDWKTDIQSLTLTEWRAQSKKTY
jgi:hypothetical protein